MSTAEAFEFDTECWCAGLPLVDRQPLTPSEREALERCSARQLRLLALASASIALLALWPNALVALPRLNDWGVLILSSAAGIGVALGIPVLVVVCFRLWQSRSRYRDDLERDEVLVFAGQLPGEQRLDDELRELFRLGLLRVEAAAPQTLRVLAASHTVFTVAPGGRLLFQKVSVAEVAPPPRYGMRVALPQNTAWINSEPNVEFLKRTLTREERAELAAHIRRLQHPRRALIAFAAYAVLIAIAVVVEGPADAIQRHGVLLAAQLILVGSVVALYGRSLMLAAKLRQDMATGWALTFHRREPVEAEEVPAAGASDPREGLEFLPHSLTAWIEHGRPARWRNLRARS